MSELKKRLPDLVVTGLAILALGLISRTQAVIPIYPYEKINWEWILSLEGEDKIESGVRAGILPHDAVSHKELTAFYRGLALNNSDIENIVVISPNHFEKGTANIQTTVRGFQTTTGVLRADRGLGRQLQASGVGEIAGEVFAKEHGITMQVNYVKEFFPKAKFLPIIIRPQTTAREIDGLVLWLTSNLPAEKTLVLGSIDFSHYLNKVQADRNDAKTLSQIKTMDLTKLPTSDEKCEFLDSPMSLRAVVQYARAVEAEQLSVVRHDNTATILNQPNLASTTSHFYITFTRL